MKSKLLDIILNNPEMNEANIKKYKIYINIYV